MHADYDEGAFGTYRLFHKLQRMGFKSCSDRLQKHATFVQCMEQSGLTPAMIDLALDAPDPLALEA